MELIGDVKGKNVILVDDMIDTVALWRKPQIYDGKGALSVRAICTHAILSIGKAYEK
jgi:ribose-phosphate pyrophosphokinase